MRVYIITCNWGHGGPGSIAKDLYNTLIGEKHEVRFAYGRMDVPQNVNGFCFTNKVDVYTHFMLSRLFDKEGFCSKKSTQRLIEDIIEFKPDIINIHNELGHVLNIPLLVGFIRKSGIKTVWTLHDAWLLTGHCITGLCKKFGNGCGNCLRKKEYPSTIIDNSRNNFINKRKLFLPKIENLSFITPSNWLSNIVNNSYLKDYEVKVINNGIDLSLFHYKPNNLKEKYKLQGKIVLLAVAGIWEKYKGIEYFKKLTRMLDDKFAFIVVGDGLPKYVKNNNRILYFARTNNVNELVDLYSMADVFVNPTMGDNFPTVNIEALACGLPVVTFNTGGSGESVGECGKVVEQGNIEAMAKAIKNIDLIKIKKEKCTLQSKKFDKNLKYCEYIKVFESVLTDKFTKLEV